MEFMSEPEAIDRVIATSKRAKANHTPGPWQHAPLSDDVIGPRGQGVCSPCENYDEDRWKVDARLIAAAPELLASLKAFVSFGDYAHNHIEDDEARAVLVEALADAKALIAKAEGR